MRSLLSCLLFFLIYSSVFAQVKRQFEEEKKGKGRTVVIKEEGSNDFDILDAEFGDAKLGQVVRITTEKVPVQREKPEKVKKIPVAQKKVQAKTVKKPKVQEALPPKTFASTPSVRYGDWKWKRVKKPRRRKYSKRKKFSSCYSF